MSASTPAFAALLTLEMIRAIRAVQTDQAAKIGAASVALTSAAKTPLVMANLAAEVEILTEPDLAMMVLQSTV